ncbi:hypothetical protein BHE74_00051288 [Ensete ventricosum]|nr:hypothetical protein BHE74_00051288 [Ensete ventricosum]
MASATTVIEETWFDTFSAIESDEEDFHSVQDASLLLICIVNFSVNGCEGEFTMSPTSYRDDDPGANDPNAFTSYSVDGKQEGLKSGEQLSMNLENTAKSFVSHEDVSVISADENAGHSDRGILNNCGILPNNCLPCLAVATSTIEKRKALSTSPPNSARKASLKLSFKRKSGEAHATSMLFSRKAFLEKPLAGSQVQFCLLEKKMFDSWSFIEPSTFRVRGEHYLRQVFFLSFRLSPDLPVLSCLLQIPLYPATIFQSETDGEGISFVLYFRLSEGYSKELPSHLLENIRVR